MDVRVIRSRTRRKTVSARLVRDTLVVSAPADLPEERLQIFIADFTARFQRRRLREALNRDGGLESRARELNDRYFGSALRWVSIEYVTGQERKYGCCDCHAGRIRISHRVGAMPGWVRDYVIVHELAHLKVPRHDRAFWDLVGRYPLAERARGFLIAVGMGEAPEEIPARHEGGLPRRMAGQITPGREQGAAYFPGEGSALRGENIGGAMRTEILRLLAEGKLRGTCLSTRIAAVIETPRGERVIGWNGPPGRAGAHARCLAGGAITPETRRDCPGVHAEVRAICRAAQAGIPVEGGTLYLSEWFPCAPCAVTMVEAGIARLVVAKKIDYAKDDCYNFGLARRYLELSGVVIEEWGEGS